MPGINFSPQCVRYALAEYGERDLGFSKSEAKLILDHLEGTESDDVTGQFYSTNPAIARKRQMMSAWCAWLDKWAERAIKEDPRLLNHDWLCESIYRGTARTACSAGSRCGRNRAQRYGAWILNKNVQPASGEPLIDRKSFMRPTMLFVALYGMARHSE
jgi:hypothetical protein